MTTYYETIDLGRCYVVQGHYGMSDKVNESNRFEFITQPEGMNIGTEYLPTHREFYDLAGESTDGAWVIIVSTADLLSDPGSVSSPDLTTAKGGTFDNFPSGASLYAIRAKTLNDFMSQISNCSWVSQCIIDLYLVPGALINFESTTTHLFGKSDNVFLFTDFNTPKPSDPDTVTTVFTLTDVWDKFIPSDEDPSVIPDKMRAYPYSVLEISTETGNPVYLKPEYLPDVVPFLCYGFCSQPYPRFNIFPSRYMGNIQDSAISYDTINIWGETVSNVIKEGMGLECACIIQNFPHLTLVNNNYQLYLASNSNRLSYQYDSAAWQLDRSNMIADAAYQNAGISYDTARANYNTQLQAQLDTVQMQAANAGYNWAGGTLNSLLSGDIGGAVTGTGDMLLSAIGMDNTNYMTQQNIAATQRDAASAITDRSTKASLAQAGVNRLLASRASIGDYSIAIAGVNAAVQDAELTPPSTVGHIGGEAFNWKNSLIGVFVTWKTIAGGARTAIKEYFLRYGYKLGFFFDPGEGIRSLMCMEKFSYWKMLDVTIEAASANEEERQTIRGIFEKGVTLWDTPEDIYNASIYDNPKRVGW